MNVKLFLAVSFSGCLPSRPSVLVRLWVSIALTLVRHYQFTEECAVRTDRGRV
jgi:hypothetical protein